MKLTVPVPSVSILLTLTLLLMQMESILHVVAVDPKLTALHLSHLRHITLISARHIQWCVMMQQRNVSSSLMHHSMITSSWE